MYKKQISLMLAIGLATTSFAQDTASTNINKTSFAFSGYVEGYYSYDFNRPDINQRPGFIYNFNRHNEFTVNLAFIKGQYQTERVRANIALAAGTYMNANYAAEPGVLKNLYEANAGYKLSAAKNLWLDVGVMPSHLGFESAEGIKNATLTRTLAAENSPYYEAGARLTYSTNNGQWVLSALALNGWQRIQRVTGNSLMSWGTQIQYKPSEKTLINYSTFIGTDQPDNNRKWRYFNNLYGVFELTPVTKLILGFDYGLEQQQKNSSQTYSWYTPVGILQIQPNSKWAIGMRGEYYSDENGVIVAFNTADKFKTVGVSANIDYRPVQQVALRLEARHFNNKDAIFIKDGIATSTNTALTAALAVAF